MDKRTAEELLYITRKNSIGDSYITPPQTAPRVSSL